MKIFATVLVTLSSWCICAAANQAVALNKPTPGTVALLAMPQGGADVRMLGAVVGDSNPVVRAVAARIAGLLSRGNLAIALQDLLQREQDVTAAVEQVRALLYLRGVEILPEDGRVRAPRKTRDMRPVYPEAMRLARIYGTVIIQATITATGCIGNAEVLRSVELPLDLAAMKAVLSWRFEPTRIDGTPVPVIMTVTVNFRLD